ncbi:Histone deacetylase complex subunit [Vermiconidia calcicola]|uniref:Histone deacetylase complex subunit n=1 Tax=Vermiconidia calcicola TaxID=1690605 RepID=A0ACC3NU39_9PEZI|nr:Histone deacetylase complex subunit [Vermiconidia calcicola]
MPSPVRRSTRGAQPAVKPAPPASTASNSSLSSNRQDRNAKVNSNPQSATPHSRSSEETSEPPRRSQRAHQLKEEEAVKDTADADEEVGEEEEVTRCICGQQEYPGPPLSEAFNAADSQSEEAGGLFISCDGCSVWQHGGCVGIIEEAQVPDKYFCEECRPKLHDAHTDSRGQKYSLYQPVNSKTNRKGSVSKNSDKGQKERETTASRASADPVTGRRRGTIRSKEHDDEEEQIQRAIEESRREVEAGGNGKKNGKRARDDSEEGKHASKRQRRASELQPSALRRVSAGEESDDEPAAAAQGRGKKLRAEVPQPSRQAQIRDIEKERERARAEAAGRRQERAGRRRVDDEAVEETPKPSTSARTSPPPSPQPGSPPADAVPGKVSHKKGAGKKVKKLGNNQYTNKNRDVVNVTSAPSPHGKKRNLANNHGISSGDEQLANGESHAANGSNGAGKSSPDHTVGGKGKFGKGKNKAVNGNGTKHDEPAELTLPNMKRRMEAMTAFIARAQLELAGDRTPSGTNGPAVSVEHVALVGGAVQPPRALPKDAAAGPAGDKMFEELSAMEMADEVSRSITNWHKEFDQLV